MCLMAVTFIQKDGLLSVRVGPMRTQMTNTQKMNNSEMIAKKIHSLRVYSLDERVSKRINANKSLSHVCSMDKRKSKMVFFNACYLDDSKSKSIHISVNTSEVEYSTNGAKGIETLVIDSSVINTPRYLN